MPQEYAGIEVTGRTCGVVGFGRIGQEVGRLATALGCRVIAYDPFLSDIAGVAASRGISAQSATLDELLAKADIVSLHVPLSDETRGLIGANELEATKPDAIIVNTSRGGIIDEDALYNAIVDGHLWGAGLDVLSVEPPGSHKLFELERVVVTPHIGAQTSEATTKTGLLAANGIIQYFAGTDSSTAAR
jgi:D-3-phosphoglycerate dehydrogenase